jgi:hypothetical protein
VASSLPCRPLPLLSPLFFPPAYSVYLFVHQRPLAILQTRIYQRLHVCGYIRRCYEEDDTTRNQPNYGGVPHVLLDYLVATSLLLVTDIEEYLHRPGQDVGAARSAMEAFLPPALRNRRNGRGSYVSTESRSPANSNENVSTSNTTILAWQMIHGVSVRKCLRRHLRRYLSTTLILSSIWRLWILMYRLCRKFHRNINLPFLPSPSSTLPPLPTLGRTPTIRRRLPQPPGQATPITPARTEQLWGLSSAHPTPDLTLPTDSPDSSMSTPPPLPSSPTTVPAPTTNERVLASSMSINRRQLPPQRQPPQLPIPIPPKLKDDLVPGRCHRLRLRRAPIHERNSGQAGDPVRQFTKEVAVLGAWGAVNRRNSIEGSAI